MPGACSVDIATRDIKRNQILNNLPRPVRIFNNCIPLILCQGVDGCSFISPKGVDGCLVLKCFSQL